jgi:hypothetical protein
MSPFAPRLLRPLNLIRLGNESTCKRPTGKILDIDPSRGSITVVASQVSGNSGREDLDHG